MNPETIHKLKKVISNYDLPGSLIHATQCVNGHINDTYRVTLARDNGSKDQLILQRINIYVFKDPIKVMHNINEVTRHLQSKQKRNDCNIISFLDNNKGKNYTCINGDYWRVCRFVKDSVTHEFVEDSQVLFSAGYAFGRFQYMLSDFPMDKLYETIPGFHNTRKRLEDFFKVVSLDPLGRLNEVREEVVFFEDNTELASKLCVMQERGEVPLRVTHNDTKYDNILMHKDTCQPLCVIDLDTVMPGLAMHDFGDAIRFAANTAVEDETNLCEVGLNMENYREFTKGFLSASQSFLTPKEKDTMALGAVTITIELASRFLADHINGDKYFKIHRKNHNLDRARCQIRLARDMLAKYDQMCEIVIQSSTGEDFFDEVAVSGK